MRQVLFEIPGTGVRIFGFGLMLFLAFLASMGLASRLARRSRLDPEIVYDLAFWLFLGGLVGARLFYFVQYSETIDSFWTSSRSGRGASSSTAASSAAAAGFFLYWRRRRFPLRPMLDVAAPAIALGCLGRLGCFLNGCCYGDVCDLPWAVRFPAETLALDRPGPRRPDRPAAGALAAGAPDAALFGPRRPDPDGLAARPTIPSAAATAR